MSSWADPGNYVDLRNFLLSFAMCEGWVRTSGDRRARRDEEISLPNFAPPTSHLPTRMGSREGIIETAARTTKRSLWLTSVQRRLYLPGISLPLFSWCRPKFWFPDRGQPRFVITFQALAKDRARTGVHIQDNRECSVYKVQHTSRL